MKIKFTAIAVILIIFLISIYKIGINSKVKEYNTGFCPECHTRYTEWYFTEEGEQQIHYKCNTCDIDGYIKNRYIK